jgi:hypothetical protein
VNAPNNAAGNAPGINSAGTASSSGSGGSGGAATGGGTGTVSNMPGIAGTTGGKIDGTVTKGPAKPGDEVINAETAPGAKVNKKVNNICKGC